MLGAKLNKEEALALLLVEGKGFELPLLFELPNPESMLQSVRTKKLSKEEERMKNTRHHFV